MKTRGIIMAITRRVEYALRNSSIGWRINPIIALMWNSTAIYNTWDCLFHVETPLIWFHYFNWQELAAEHQHSKLKSGFSIGNGRNFSMVAWNSILAKKVLINLKSHETNHKVAITHLNICCSFLGSWELSPLWTHLIQNGWL